MKERLEGNNQNVTNDFFCLVGRKVIFYYSFFFSTFNIAIKNIYCF